MKTKIITLITLTAFMLSTQQTDAKILRVGYWGTSIVNVDYSTLQLAHNAAAAGDTLLIFPGSWSATYSKKLVTIGYGYFTDTVSLGTGANKDLQNINGQMSINITLTTGSDDCKFEGLDGFAIGGSGNGAAVNNITVSRCNGSVNLGQKNVFSNWQVLQSYITSLNLVNVSGGSISSLLVSNCYISYITGAGNLGTAANQTGQFINCVVDYGNTSFNNGSFILKNNIFVYTVSADLNCVYQYNLFNKDYHPVPAGTGNIGVSNTVMGNAVFVGYDKQTTYTKDGRWVLKIGSLAIGAGEGGTNMGIYGGINPYRLSGIPRIPAIYKLTAPSSTTSGNPYTITLSVRSNN